MHHCFALVWILLVIGVSVVSAVTPVAVYVSTTGCDANNGTQQFPVLTLRRAVELMPGSGTIFIQSGIYPGVNNTNITFTHPINIIGYGQDRPIIQGPVPLETNSFVGFTRTHGYIANIELVDFNVLGIGGDNAKITLHNMRFTRFSYSAIATKSTELKITDCHFVNTTTDDVTLIVFGMATDEAKNFTLHITNSLFKNCTSLIGASSIRGAFHVTIKDTTFEKNALTSGLYFYNLLQPTVRAEMNDMRLDNCSFIDNYAATMTPWLIGIQTSMGVFTMTNTRLQNNTFASQLVFIDITVGSATVVNCSFLENSANGPGACIYEVYRFNVATSYQNCLFANTRLAHGGVLSVAAPSSLITNCSFVNNSASHSGLGAAVVTGALSLLNISDSRFVRNYAYHGTALTLNGRMVAQRCVFEHNRAAFQAGAVVANAICSTPIIAYEITDSVFTDNASGFWAGAVAIISTCILSVTNTSFTNNSALLGGAIEISLDGSLICNNCQFQGNRAVKQSHYEPAGSIMYIGDFTTLELINSALCAVHEHDVHPIICYRSSVVITNTAYYTLDNRESALFSDSCNVTLRPWIVDVDTPVATSFCTGYNLSLLLALPTAEMVSVDIQGNLSLPSEVQGNATADIECLVWPVRNATQWGPKVLSDRYFADPTNRSSPCITSRFDGPNNSLNISVWWNNYYGFSEPMLSLNTDLALEMAVSSAGGSLNNGTPATATFHYTVSTPTAYLPHCETSPSSNILLLTSQSRDIEITVRDQWKRSHSLNASQSADRNLKFAVTGVNDVSAYVHKLPQSGKGKYQYAYRPEKSGQDTVYLIDNNSKRHMFDTTIVWMWWLVVGSLGFLGLILLVVVTAIMSRRLHRRWSRMNALKNYEPLRYEIFQMNNTAFPADLEVQYKDITILEERVTGGAQGEISVGLWNGTKVVLKRCPITSEEDVDHLISEAQLLKSLRHPNVVQLMGICKQPPCIVMEMVARGSLYALLHSPNASQVTRPRILSMALDIARGMAFLHSRSILHRDLKSSNLLVTESWNIKIADLGLSRKASTTMTAAVGTPRWTAPEVYQGEHYTGKADVFSFAVILWELVEKKLPWENYRWAMEVRQVVVAGLRPGLVSSEWTPDLRRLVEVCWQQEPSARPSFEDIVHQLTGFTVEPSTGATLAAVV